MRVRVLNLDRSLLSQRELAARYQPEIIPLEEQAPTIRVGCRFRQFRRFEHALTEAMGADRDERPYFTFYGSGDFHHVSLALLRRQRQPFNLVVFDNHPDWMRGVPFFHCGTWLYHAARLPHVQHIFHIGGNVDFDNHYQWLAPWRLLKMGRITVIPAFRRYQRGRWRKLAHDSLKHHPEVLIAPQRWEEVLDSHREELRRWPLYLSLDKDVMRSEEAPVNWDSGHLSLAEVCGGVRSLLGAAQHRVAGIDVLGDWSPVRVRGVLRRFLHLTEHPTLEVDAGTAVRLNERANLALLQAAALREQIAQPLRIAI